MELQLNGWERHLTEKKSEVVIFNYIFNFISKNEFKIMTVLFRVLYSTKFMQEKNNNLSH